MVQRVYVIETLRTPAYPLTMVESIVVGFCVGSRFVHRHQDVSFWAIAMVMSALAGYLMFHASKATVWITLIAGAVLWGGIGWGIAHGAWQGSWLAQGICASAGALLSMAEKARAYEMGQAEN